MLITMSFSSACLEKKRHNVPYHRKWHRTPAKLLNNITHNSAKENNTSIYLSDPNIAVADHAYFTLTNENTTIAKNGLDDEFDETLNTTNKLCEYINTDHAYIQSACKNTSIADYSLDNELDTSDDIEYVPVEEQCTTTVHVQVDTFTELNKSARGFRYAISVQSKLWKYPKNTLTRLHTCTCICHL